MIFAAVHFSCEAGEAFSDDPGAVERIVLSELGACAETYLPPELRPPEPWPEAPPGQRLRIGLKRWASSCPRPIVLLMDEIDALRGESLRTVLRQLRAGFHHRPNPGETGGGFPASVILCGLSDVRDYKAASGGDPARLGTSSPFNITLESLRIGDFDQGDIARLFAQHTAETGQIFADGAVDHVFTLTGGQPWLVNALAREVIEKIGVPPEQAITIAHLERAKERLIRARQTHLDSLACSTKPPASPASSSSTSTTRPCTSRSNTATTPTRWSSFATSCPPPSRTTRTSKKACSPASSTSPKSRSFRG